MVYQVNGPKGPATTEKTKAKGRVGVAGGPSFAEALADAQAQAEPPSNATMATAGGLALPTFIAGTEEEIAQDTKGQTAQLLKQLRELADAALGGTGRPSLHQLQQLAESAATDEATLSPQQHKALNEARTRAAVEAAKNSQK
jgi:hypothetical protein